MVDKRGEHGSRLMANITLDFQSMPAAEMAGLPDKPLSFLDDTASHFYKQFAYTRKCKQDNVTIAFRKLNAADKTRIYPVPVAGWRIVTFPSYTGEFDKGLMQHMDFAEIAYIGTPQSSKVKVQLSPEDIVPAELGRIETTKKFYMAQGISCNGAAPASFDASLLVIFNAATTAKAQYVVAIVALALALF